MNPLIKKPNKLKEKIRNFFTIPEKDLQEEEGTKIFEKLPLVTLTRNKIFLAIFSFLIIVNMLVGFDLNFIYLRQILGFLFLILVPGLLIMLCFKIRSIGFWESLVYTIGLSIAFVMFAGLAVNWILPWLEITNQPLSLWPILICFNIFFVILGITAWIRNKDFQPFQLSVPKLDTINNIFFIIPMIFPVLSVLGAFILNNHGSNILTMIMLGGIAVYVLLLVIFRKKMNENIWPWALYWIGLALVLMGSMRSWFLSTTDASLEIYFAKEVILNSIWGIGNLNGYNAMLSITIFPTILSHFSAINLYFIFKLLFPIIFSFISIIIYLIFNKYFNKIISFFGGLFFIFQPTITGWHLLPPRQEIAYLFLGFMLLVLFTKKINPTLKKVLFFVFGISMIVSHYSTTYIALAIFTIIYFFILIYKIHENRKVKKGKIHQMQKLKFYLTGTLILLILLFGFLWYSQITTTADAAISFIGTSFDNFNKIFSNEVYSAGSSPLEYLNIFNPKPIVNSTTDLNNYNKNIENNSLINKSQIYSQANNYPLSIKSSSQLPYSERFYEFIDLSGRMEQILLLLGTFFIFIGLLYILFSRGLRYNPLFKLLLMTFSISFIFIAIIPFASTNYNLNRLYQQELIMLSVFSIIGFFILFKKMKITSKLIIFVTFLILYLLIFTHVQYYFLGGGEVQLRFANIGKNYDMEYTSSSEIDSTNWLFLNKESNIAIISDTYAESKNYQSEQFSYNTIIKIDILPIAITKKDYVYSSRTNTIQKITFKYYGRGLLIYNFPTEFLNYNKNKIYNNGGSEIFR